MRQKNVEFLSPKNIDNTIASIFTSSFQLFTFSFLTQLLHLLVPTEDPIVWREKPTKISFLNMSRQLPPVKHFMSKSYIVYVPVENLILSIFRAKNKNQYFFQVFKLGFTLQVNSKFGFRKSDLKCFCEAG